MSSFFGALAPSVASLAESVAPQAGLSFDEIIDEVRRLRDENATLRTQVGMLSSIKGGGRANAAQAGAGADAATSSGSTDGAPASSVGGASSTSVGPREREHAAAIACLVNEMCCVEASMERVRLTEAVARDELAMRCEELGRALEQRVSQAEQFQRAAVATAQQQSAAKLSALEEQLATMTEEAARREALADTYGVDHELAEAEQRALAAMAQSEHRAAEARRLHDELRELKLSHAAELLRTETKVAEAEAALASQQQSTAAHESVVRALQGQLVRLSEGFNKQVEEVFALQQQLQAAKASTVDKAIARSWVVNYVESGNTARGDEMLQLMAEWWDFSEADMQRVGLTNAPHPEREYRSGLSWSDAFATFLDDQAKTEDPFARPSPRSPSAPSAPSSMRAAHRNGSLRAPREASLSEAVGAEPSSRARGWLG